MFKNKSSVIPYFLFGNCIMNSIIENNTVLKNFNYRSTFMFCCFNIYLC